MRYLVNGVEADLEAEPGVEVRRLSDRSVVRTAEGAASALSVRVGDAVLVSYMGRTFIVERASAGRSWSKTAATGEIRAPMPGQVVEVFVEQGTRVVSGRKLVVLEAMKMQHTVTAPFDGTVAALPVKKGEQVGEGQLLVHVEGSNE